MADRRGGRLRVFSRHNPHYTSINPITPV
jgi:hypothetical protein